jgi:predicted RNA binding protein YcfA (HicA-like mRNA interferase family)
MMGYLVRTRGSHRQYKHPIKSGLVTITGKLSEDIASGTVNSISTVGWALPTDHI